MTEKIYQIDDIKNIVAPIAQRYGAERIYLFGSYARGIDLLDKFQKNIDLLTTESLDDDFLNMIMNEEVLIYDKQR